MESLCFVVYDLSIVGGVERVVESLANKLSNDYKIYIVSLHGTACNEAFCFDNSIAVDFLDLPKERLRNQMIKGTTHLHKYFKEHHIKVAFLEATYAGFIGSPLGLISKTKTVFCDHGALLNQINDRDITLMRRTAAVLSNKIVVLTLKSKNDYKRLFQIRDQKVSFIYNWINESLINSERKYNIDSKTIVTAGRFTKEKGFDLLLDVAKELFPSKGGWEWHIYGEGPLKADIEAKIKDYKLQNSVILKGFSNDMDEVYKNAAMYVLPSYREGVPLVLLEAKAYKLPLISFDIVTGPNEIIEDNVNGYLIKPYETEHMAQVIRALMEDREKRMELSEHAYSNIDKFREDTIYRNWASLIKSLI